MTISVEAIQIHKVNGPWRTLEAIAFDMVKDAERTAKSNMAAALGGGTRLMLAMNHSISDDVDIFIPDPQWLGYLSPRLNDRFEEVGKDYDENAISLKLYLDGGQIDFIVRSPLMGLQNTASSDSTFLLEPVMEVLAKKLFHRGWSLTPRDLFDWYCIESNELLSNEQQLTQVLERKFDEISLALVAMSSSPSAELIWSAIRTHSLPNMQETICWAKHRISQLSAKPFDNTRYRPKGP